MIREFFVALRQESTNAEGRPLLHDRTLRFDYDIIAIAAGRIGVSLLMR
jgi:hypothetical protein